MSTTATATIHNHRNTTASRNHTAGIHQNNDNSNTIIHKQVDTVKTKRSLDRENPPECDPFIIGDLATNTFYSPGYPKEYTKNISCVRIIEGKWILSKYICCYLILLRFFSYV